MSTTSLDVTFVRPWLASCWSGLKQCIAEWRRRARSRRELADLDEMSLADIGVSRSQALYEASKPFWTP